tara:strand:+ start:790 stop:1470 length:681 start_codon:yes stop_codon:yes gene_type:complete
MLLNEAKIRDLIREALSAISNDRSNSSSRATVDVGGEIESLVGLEFESVSNDQAAKIAIEEFATWKEGKLKEDQEEAYPLLKKYWDGLGDWPESRWKPTETAWSAAFISFVMKKSGDDFYNSAAHTTYATKALQNRQKLAGDPKSLAGVQHVLFLKGEAEPTIGDVMFYVREGSLEGWMAGGGGQKASHTDIYIGNNKGIGGNISDSVSKSSAMSKHSAIIKKINI